MSAIDNSTKDMFSLMGVRTPSKKQAPVGSEDDQNALSMQNPDEPPTLIPSPSLGNVLKHCFESHILAHIIK